MLRRPAARGQPHDDHSAKVFVGGASQSPGTFLRVIFKTCADKGSGEEATGEVTTPRADPSFEFKSHCATLSSTQFLTCSADIYYRIYKATTERDGGNREIE